MVCRSNHLWRDGNQITKMAVLFVAVVFIGRVRSYQSPTQQETKIGGNRHGNDGPPFRRAG
jgi:hypothetical protein